MKYLKRFANAQEAATVLATWPFNTISSIEGQSGVRYSEGVPVGPVIPTDRVILKFMVTNNDWSEDAGKYKKQLVADNSGALFYDGSCFDYMIKDNERIDENFWSQFIYFDTLGEHTVELVFGEEFDGNLPFACLWGCGIYEVVIPSCVTVIGSSAFHLCTSLTSVNIPDAVTSIGSSAFESCTSLTSVNIPDAVTSIDFYAFHDCSDLTSVAIGSGVTTIEYEAFYECRSLTSITCNAINPPTLGGDVFSYTNNCPLYVPASSVDTYKAASGWSDYASRIQAIQS